MAEWTQEECNRRHDNVWEAIGDVRKWRLGIYKSLGISGFLAIGTVLGFGLAWDNMSDAIAENKEAVKGVVSKEQIKNTQLNQKALAEGINSLAEQVGQVADKVGVETERPPHVVIRVDGDGGD
jgi:hypothetical protein